MADAGVGDSGGACLPFLARPRTAHYSKQVRSSVCLSTTLALTNINTHARTHTNNTAKINALALTAPPSFQSEAMTSTTASSQQPQLPSFAHPRYTLVDNDRIVRRAQEGDGPSPPSTTSSCTDEDYQSVVESLSTYIKEYLQARFDLVQHWIPAGEEDTPAKCDVLLSRNWETAPKLLVVLQNHVGSQLGMWSRSTCVAKGLRAGSMLPFLEQAHQGGYAVIVCNPNLNSVVVDGKKLAVSASAFPEEHALYVYETFVAYCQAQHVFLFGYGNGAMLCKEMLQRQLVRCQQQTGEVNRIAGIATVEASRVLEEDDSTDVKALLGAYAVDWEASLRLPPGHAIPKARTQLGIAQVLSVGTLAEEGESDMAPSTAWSVVAARDSVFRFFDFCLQDALQHPATAAVPSIPSSPSTPKASSRGITTATTPLSFSTGSTLTPRTPNRPGLSSLLRKSNSSNCSSPGMEGGSPSVCGPVSNRGYLFSVAEATRCGVPAPPSPKGPASSVRMLGQQGSSGSSSSLSPSRSSSDNSSSSFLRRLRRMISSGLSLSRSHSSERGFPASPAGSKDLGRALSSDGGSCRSLALTERLDISDFDLLKVVGKGAFGKVMLVKKKKAGQGAGRVYAMKVLNKDSVVKKGQIEHTMSERAILCQIRHPFIVRLRFAFQNETSLYLVTDYYTGGSLFYHLRKNGSFAEPRARFYAAELLLALEHLHEQFIIYRDLKLENILMDSEGNIALTDFGLSKQNVRTEACATTFCGTAEYLAPELLRGKAYGAPVDWWSFGILLYEMMDGRTPFYNKNRKYMFHCIVHIRPTFPPHFSKPAQGLMNRLLEPDPARRPQAAEIKAHAFFADLDFDKLYRKKLTPPFNPRVKNEMDIKFVPSNYHKLPPKESLAEPTGAGACAAAEFKAFTYHGDSSHLG